MHRLGLLLSISTVENAASNQEVKGLNLDLFPFYLLSIVSFNRPLFGVASLLIFHKNGCSAVQLVTKQA